MRSARYIFSITFAALCALLLIANPSHATPGQPGTLDGTFASLSPLGPGKTITPVGVGRDLASALALQRDGKVVLAGGCFNGVNQDFCAVRYKSDGTLDTTFNSTGKVITAIGTIDNFAATVAIQPDGKIVLAGTCFDNGTEDFCAARYNADGTLDTAGFGTGGKVITPLGTGADKATAIVIQPDGKIVLAGTCTGITNSDFCALRYNANGTLDTTGFGTGGVVITPVGTGNDRANAAAIQSDGKILLAGHCVNGANLDFCAIRYNTNGTLDTSTDPRRLFGTSGKVITPVGSFDDLATKLVIQPDGKLVLAGNCVISAAGNTDFCALRYNANGSLDTSFGTAGKVITQVGAVESAASGLAIQPDGSLLLVGLCRNSGALTAPRLFCSLRYYGDGTVDTSFGTAGKVFTTLGPDAFDVASAVAMQPDGKIVLAGYCSNGTDFDFCALRYDGGPFGYKACSLDIDGDGSIRAASDMIISARAAFGITGDAVIAGVSFASHASRTSWPLIREYLVTQCGMSLAP
jgi:uncharacterized delta-60 repeat protein